MRKYLGDRARYNLEIIEKAIQPETSRLEETGGVYAEQKLAAIEGSMELLHRAVAEINDPSQSVYYKRDGDINMQVIEKSDDFLSPLGMLHYRVLVWENDHGETLTPEEESTNISAYYTVPASWKEHTSLADNLNLWRLAPIGTATALNAVEARLSLAPQTSLPLLSTVEIKENIEALNSFFVSGDHRRFVSLQLGLSASKIDDPTVHKLVADHLENALVTQWIGENTRFVICSALKTIMESPKSGPHVDHSQLKFTMMQHARIAFEKVFTPSARRVLPPGVTRL